MARAAVLRRAPARQDGITTSEQPAMPDRYEHWKIDGESGHTNSAGDGIDFHIDGFAGRAVICATTSTADVTGFTVNFPMFKSVRHRRLLTGCNAVLATGARLKTAALAILWRQAI